MHKHPRRDTCLVRDREIPLRLCRCALRKQNHNTADQRGDTQKRHRPQQDGVPLGWVHQTMQQRDDSQLRDAKGHDAKGEAEDGPEDGALLLIQAQGVKVLPVSVLDGHDG